MGCGCSKKGAAPALSSSRITVYEVEVGGAVVSEFGTLAEARIEAVKIDGKIKVTSKPAA